MRSSLLPLLGVFIVQVSFAQDPHLPSTNLGLTNMQDGHVPGAGWYYNQFVQTYEAKETKDDLGRSLPGAGSMSSVLALEQVVFIGNRHLLGGNLGFTLIIPVIKLSTANLSGPAPSVNPGYLGDVVVGPILQWFDNRLFGMKYDHRLELDFSPPTGSYDSRYAINPGSHLFRIFPHYTFTLSPTKALSFSMRHHLNYYFREIGTKVRPGITYNFNYSAEYALTHQFTLELAGYYLDQLEQDHYDGDGHYYQEKYGLATTKERVLGYGPGIGYLAKSGLFMELKGMWETAVINRTEGFRATLFLAYRL